MAVNGLNGWTWLEMSTLGWKWLEMEKNWLEKDGNCWKLIDHLETARNDRQWLEMA